MTTHHPLHKDFTTLRLLAVVLFITISTGMWHLMTRGTCMRYDSQAEAQKALSKYPKLDGHPKDGLACNSYFK